MRLALSFWAFVSVFSAATAVAQVLVTFDEPGIGTVGIGIAQPIRVKGAFFNGGTLYREPDGNVVYISSINSPARLP
ncbi:MAG TPA: hypothetical protein VFN10_04450 [Thermoanaerobaculia bacterium]|nr:hypothetical protein [Thermoanaerobaculia bacterium]